MLYPIDSRTRETKSLDGLWSFKLDPHKVSTEEKWEQRKLTDAKKIAVPASYNEQLVLEDPDFVGDGWYQKEVYVPKSWHEEDSAINLRIGAAYYHTTVYINGQKAGSHSGGYLPFDINIRPYLKVDKQTVITIKLNNELSYQTLPPGTVETVPHGDGTKKVVRQQHDFFAYTGIHRSVYLYKLPKQHIDDIRVETDVKTDVGIVHVSTECQGNLVVKYCLFDQDEKVVAFAEGDASTLVIEDVKLWEPGKSYLYRLHVSAYNEADRLIDEYELNVGVRTVRIEDGRLLVNNKPIYLKGFGKHEDMDVKGKGFDHAMMVKDYSLLHWTGANSFRTAHYPYAEEWLHMADEEGILIIDEAPAVGMLGQAVPAIGELDGVFTETKINHRSMQNHRSTMEALIKRDRNHPSVIMWSVANEASTMEPQAREYFTPIIHRMRELDDRPIMNVNLMLIEPEKCQVSDLVDVIGLNLYFGWYDNPGNLVEGERVLSDWLDRYYECFRKPIVVTEYGVDTIAGLHRLPATMFSEEFQTEFLSTYHRVFDNKEFVIGEQVWNFADFMTGQGIVRVDGNKKGIFTRQRQPKLAAHTLRARWK